MFILSCFTDTLATSCSNRANQPLRAKGVIDLVSPNLSDRKGNNKVSKCNLKK